MSEKKIEIDNDILFLIEKMIESGVNEGIQKGLKQYDNMQKNKTKFRYDKRLRNTRLLLKNYRSFVDHCDNAKYLVENPIKKEIEKDNLKVQLFDDFYNLQDDAYIVASILKSKEKTRIILDHINLCLDFFQAKAIKTNNQEMIRRYNVISDLYINETPMTYEEIAEIEHISQKTVNRDRKKAIEELSVLIFGIDGLDLS
uniref:M protein trans-acting positive regulator (MGA) HTH domain n=1 Tax=Siphoviridae sp. cthh925 TaxID=2826425 RepID=A0A8S5NM54_9CAUD|nr:MAG TPA: M protein trans-acting positive regulator (MGA) HTH domain [Siphoviridae sp. cthh925]